MAKIESNLGKKMLYSAQSSRLSRCFAPSGACQESAIRAHPVQNGAVMAILHRDGHVKAQSRFNRCTSSESRRGSINGNQPEAAGMMAVERMLRAHSTYVYKTELDNALTNCRHEALTHEIIRRTNQVPAVAASVFLDLDRRSNEQVPRRMALNIFPTSSDEPLQFSVSQTRMRRRFESIFATSSNRTVPTSRICSPECC
jgi:hypothetical protein